MKPEDVRNIARNRGVHPGQLSKTEPFKTLQADEGNFDRFATASGGECVRLAVFRASTVLMLPTIGEVS